MDKMLESLLRLSQLATKSSIASSSISAKLSPDLTSFDYQTKLDLIKVSLLPSPILIVLPKVK